MRSVGIVGLPGSGVSTIFAALGGDPEGSSPQAAVAVPDERLDALAAVEGSKKRTPGRLVFVDASARVRRGGRATGSLPAELLGYLRESDLLLLVVRAFGGADPAADLAELRLELVLADLSVIVAKRERTVKEAQAHDPAAVRLAPALEAAARALDANRPLRDAHLDDGEREVLEPLDLLTMKPVVVVANMSDEGGPVPPGAIAVAGRLEREVAGMDATEAGELLASYGVEGRAVDRVTGAVHDALGVVTFFTVASSEARAWVVRAGAPAPEAAGAIHTDMERGFIRADVCSWADVVEAGGWGKARAAGAVRQEGRAYRVAEGDVIEFRFAV